jgi:hypothetical protein
MGSGGGAQAGEERRCGRVGNSAWPSRCRPATAPPALQLWVVPLLLLLVTGGEAGRGGAGEGGASLQRRPVISMSVMGEDEVIEYRRRRRRLLSGPGEMGGMGTNLSEAVGPFAARRRQQGHVDFSNKKVMEGALGGNTMPLGYYYARVHVGTPGQVFTVIVDTGSSLMAIPCQGCSRCGKHMNPYFQQSKSSTYIDGCSNIPNCHSCSGAHCTYRTHFVEGSSIGGNVAMDQVSALIEGKTEPQFSAKGVFGCQMSETGLFKAQLADGIMGLGYGSYPTMFDSLVAEHKVRNTLSFCIHRQGGYIQFGADPPTDPKTISTPLHPHSKYYVLKIKDMKVGATGLGLSQSVYNMGHGAIIDSGTSLSYYPRQAYQRMRQVFSQETRSMNLGRGERIDGADCWRVERAPGGLSSFPTYSIEFEGTGLQEFHPVHYMFNHPQVKNPTHYCYGILDNGMAGLVLGSLFQRHFFMQIDRENNKIHMVTDMCGDTGLDKMLGNRAPPPPPPLQGKCDVTQLKQATDFAGADLSPDPMQASDVSMCCALCANDRDCYGFTFVVKTGMCWLKGQGYVEKSNSDVVSGHRSAFVVKAADSKKGVAPVGPAPPLPPQLEKKKTLPAASEREQKMEGAERPAAQAALKRPSPPTAVAAASATSAAAASSASPQKSEPHHWNLETFEKHPL